MKVKPDKGHQDCQPPDCIVYGAAAVYDKNTQGELYTIDIRFNIAQPIHRRNKRLFDVVLSVLCLVLSPILVLFVKNRSAFLKNMVSILFNNQTFVGYTDGTSRKYREGVSENLPKIKRGILSPINAVNLTQINEPTVQRLNFLYAKDYDVWRDVEIVFNGFKRLSHNFSRV